MSLDPTFPARDGGEKRAHCPPRSGRFVYLPAINAAGRGEYRKHDLTCTCSLKPFATVVSALARTLRRRWRNVGCFPVCRRSVRTKTRRGGEIIRAAL